jgi:hypothetical protein
MNISVSSAGHLPDRKPITDRRVSNSDEQRDNVFFSRPHGTTLLQIDSSYAGAECFSQRRRIYVLRDEAEMTGGSR